MSVSTLLVRAIVEAIERAGASRTELLARAHIDPSRLERADGRFEADEFARLQELAVDLTGDQAFALHMGQEMSESSLDILAYLVGHAPTVRDAVRVAMQFGPLGVDGTHLALRDVGDRSVIEYAFPRSTPVADRMHAEFVLAGFLRLARQYAGARVAPLFVGFEHERPSHHKEYTRMFGGAEHFAQDKTSIAFERCIVDTAQLHQNPELYSLVRAQAERKLEQVVQGVGPTDRLRQYLLARPPARIPDMATAAKDLGMSERSLRRHLAAESASYRDIVRSTLETTAGHMLRDPNRTIQETAIALGFADAATFHRAFKGWTGMTPKQYRETGGGR